MSHALDATLFIIIIIILSTHPLGFRIENAKCVVQIEMAQKFSNQCSD